MPWRVAGATEEQRKTVSRGANRGHAPETYDTSYCIEHPNYCTTLWI